MLNKLCCILSVYGRCVPCDTQWCHHCWNADFTHYTPSNGHTLAVFFCPKGGEIHLVQTLEGVDIVARNKK